ncbi:MAG TPA: helix-turn-helix transcriptional regulator [Mycobacterium sp.]|nr:helix-turn-helix transcriptional regulator [Mycobacterium sp.]
MGRRERIEDYFRKRLKDERDRREWSQAQMAELLSDIMRARVHPTTIAKIEAGDRAVRIDEATAIADIFEMSLDSLLGRTAQVDNDPTYSIRALRDKAMKYVRDVGVISRSFRDTLVDVHGLEFDGRETLESEGERAVKALDQAQRALWEVAGFELPAHGGVGVRRSRVRPSKGIKSATKS